MSWDFRNCVIVALQKSMSATHGRIMRVPLDFPVDFRWNIS